MRISIELESICSQEALRYLGWKGKCEDERVLEQLEHAERIALESIRPLVVLERFALGKGKIFKDTTFLPRGKDAMRLLDECNQGVLFAATLGASSEQLIIREQARSCAEALVLDAVLSAAIEAVCDRACATLAQEVKTEGSYLTRRFSPGYGDMPMTQTREICAVLDAYKRIGLSVSASGLMIPRKSVSAIMGVSKKQQATDMHDCDGCERKASCAMRKDRK